MHFQNKTIKIEEVSLLQVFVLCGMAAGESKLQ